MNEKNELIVVIGPTGSGKTDLAIKMAKHIGGAIVSADSRQVYKGMDVGTAKNINRKVKQYLVDIRNPDQPLSLSQWQQMAFKKIDELMANGTVPLLVGGTMLYVDSVVDNYDIPKIEPNSMLRDELEKQPADDLYKQLMNQDSAAAEYIEPGNKRRIIRALEVMEATGRPFSEVRRKREPRYKAKMIGLFSDWDELEDRLAVRSKQMIRDGLIEETESLIKKYRRDLPLLQTINYQQTLEYLAGELDKDELVAAMTRANLKYARRQMSWWRRRHDINWQKKDPRSYGTGSYDLTFLQ